MRNKKRNRILFLLILLLGIGIGFAALATTLKINGSAIITKNTWNIYWDNVANETGVTPETHPTITADENNVPKTLLTWSVTLNEPGDFYEFEVDAVNAGTLDAEIIGLDSKVGNDSIISTVEGELVEANPSPVPSYVKYSVKYADGSSVGLGDKLPKAPDLTSTPPVYTRKTYKIRVEYDRNAVTNAQVNGMEDDVTLTFTYHVTYGQANPVVAVAFATDSWDTIAIEGPTAAEQTTTNGTCGAYNVGDTKNVNIDMDGNGTPETYTVRIANCSTPTICSTSGFSQTACGFVVEFTEVITSHRINAYYGGGSTWQVDGDGSKGGWERTDMRAYLNNQIYDADAYDPAWANYDEYIDYTSTGLLGKLPSDLQAVIEPTTVVSGYGQYNTAHGNYTTHDKLYLLDVKEIYGSGFTDQYNSAKDSERQLDYYNLQGVTTDSETYAPTVKSNLSGNNDTWHWWLRTPYTNSDCAFYRVNLTGGWGSDSANMTYGGVSPAFKLK